MSYSGLILLPKLSNWMGPVFPVILVARICLEVNIVYTLREYLNKEKTPDIYLRVVYFHLLVNPFHARLYYPFIPYVDLMWEYNISIDLYMGPDSKMDAPRELVLNTR